MPLELRPGMGPIYLPWEQGRLRAERDISRVPPRRHAELVLAEARRVVCRARLMGVGVEEVRRGRVVIWLGHHVCVLRGELLLGVGSKQRGVELWFAGRRREDGEVAVAKVGGEEVRRLLLLGLRGEGGRARGAKGRGVRFDLISSKGRGQVESNGGGGVRKAGLGERLRGGLLVAQEAPGVCVVSREVGLGY